MAFETVSGRGSGDTSREEHGPPWAAAARDPEHPAVATDPGKAPHPRGLGQGCPWPPSLPPPEFCERAHGVVTSPGVNPDYPTANRVWHCDNSAAWHTVDIR